MKVSDWIVDGHCAYRSLVDFGDTHDVKNRVAFIEKTPRVRIYAPNYAWQSRESVHSCQPAERDAWVFGPKGHGGEDGHIPENKLYGHDPQSRAWCDTMLRALGYQLPE